MLRSRLSSLLFLPSFLLIFSSFFTSCYGDFSQTQRFEITPEKGLVDGDEYGLVELKKVTNGTEGSAGNASFILAAKRTRRRDPLDHFEKYTGGWNISERHYWASVGFTAAPFFIIALAWFAIFGLILLFISCYYCCCRREPYGYSRTAYALSLILLIFFTVAAIVGCIVLYTGQGKFDGSTGDTLDYIVHQANDTVVKLRNVSDYLAAAKRVDVARVLLGPDVQGRIDAIGTKIDSAADTLSQKTDENSHNIRKVFRIVRLCLVILAAVMLLLTFLGFLFSILGLKFLVSILVVIGWILVAVTFILCGVFLLLHNVLADSCVAMDQWVKNPTAHTALDDILPCVDNATAYETLMRSKQVSNQLVSVVNQFISNISNSNIPPIVGPPLYYNQSGPLVPVLCNPFYADMTDRKCAIGEVDFDNATKVWQNYVCQVSSAGNCVTVGRLTPNYYDQMSAAVNVSYGLYRYGPFLVQLEDCSFVRETFTKIHDDHCPDLKQYVRLIYIGLVMVSSAVMLSLIFWVLYARERRHRVYTKHLVQGYGHGPPGDGKRT